MLQNFLIVGTQRTGSTALVRALNFHPDIACGNEWTQDVAAHRKFHVTERALSGDFAVLAPRKQLLINAAFHAGTRWLGFKLLFRSSDKWIFHPRISPALWMDRFEAYLRWVAKRPSIHVIHIVRNDPIEWLKSKYLSDRAHMWAGKSYPEDMAIEVPVLAAIRRLATKAWIDSRLSSLARTNPYQCVSYEDFLKSDQAVVFALMDFLGCDSAKLREFDYRRHTKQSRRSASDYISNYEQLVAALKQRAIVTAM